MTVFARATPAQRAGALNVWRAARTAAGIPPSPARVDRVQEKLLDEAACLLVGCDGPVIAMALAEPYREQRGAGTIRPRTGHISMVFVDPERWGRRIGGQLLDALHQEMRARGWTISSLWTRLNNDRARRLYEGRGYQQTGEATHLRGHEILRYECQLGSAPQGPRTRRAGLAYPIELE
jgi:ribosomal protein S18 acetylase RimI-like enzyme